MAMKQIDDCFNLDKNKDNHYTFLPIYNHKYYELFSG